MFGSGAYKEKILDDIINILKEVKKTGSIDSVDKNKQLFLGKYSEIPALLSSVLHEFEEKNTGVSQEQIEAVQAEMSSELNEKCMQLEEQTLMVESSNDGLWYMHYPKDGNVNVDTPFMWSDKFRRMLGYQNTEDFPNVLGSWSLKLHPTEHDAIFAAFGASLADKTGKTPYDVKYRLKLKSGEYRWFKATGTVKRDEYGNPLMIGGSLTDIDDDVKNKFELDNAPRFISYNKCRLEIDNESKLNNIYLSIFKPLKYQKYMSFGYISKNIINKDNIIESSPDNYWIYGLGNQMLYVIEIDNNTYITPMLLKRDNVESIVNIKFSLNPATIISIANIENDLTVSKTLNNIKEGDFLTPLYPVYKFNEFNKKFIKNLKAVSYEKGKTYKILFDNIIGLSYKPYKETYQIRFVFENMYKNKIYSLPCKYY